MHRSEIDLVKFDKGSMQEFMLSALITTNMDEYTNMKRSSPKQVSNFYRQLSGGD